MVAYTGLLHYSYTTKERELRVDTQELLVKDTYPAMLSPVGEWVVNGHGAFPNGTQLHFWYEE